MLIQIIDAPTQVTSNFILEISFNIEKNYIVYSLGLSKTLKTNAVPSQKLPIRKFAKIVKLRRTKNSLNAGTYKSPKNINPSIPPDLYNDESTVEYLSTNMQNGMKNMNLSDSVNCEKIAECSSSNVIRDTTNTSLSDSVTHESTADSSPLNSTRNIYSSDAIAVSNFEETIIEDLSLKFEVGVQVSTKTKNKSQQTVELLLYKESILFDAVTEKNLKYFTGFNSKRFNFLWQCLCQARGICLPTQFNRHLEQKDQLILCLFKYKSNTQFKLMALIYGINANLISDIFKCWTREIYKYLKSVNFWNLRYKDENAYTVVLDCSEIPTQTSSLYPHVNQQLFSNYKNRLTLKYLVGIDEKRFVIYVSDAYVGCISDNEIVECSGILNLLNEGDTVLSDRGFTCTEILEQKGVALNVPPFKGRRDQFEEEEVFETRVVANRRIHVERVIGLSKKNLILSQIFPAHLWDHAKEIIYNANMLCNFKNSVVS